MKTFNLILVICLALSLCSWKQDQIKGSGNVVKEQRTVSFFNKLEASTGIHIILTQATSEPLTIEAEDNVMPYIITEIEGTTLHISLKSNKTRSINLTKTIKVYISVENLEEIEGNSAAAFTATTPWHANKLDLDLSSAATIDMTLEVNTLDLDISSAAKATLQGQADIMEAEVSSAASLNAELLTVRRADIEVSSAAYACINVTEELEFETSSAGKLEYYGSPRITKAETDRSSTKRLGDRVKNSGKEVR